MPHGPPRPVPEIDVVVNSVARLRLKVRWLSHPENLVDEDGLVPDAPIILVSLSHTPSSRLAEPPIPDDRITSSGVPDQSIDNRLGVCIQIGFLRGGISCRQSADRSSLYCKAPLGNRLAHAPRKVSNFHFQSHRESAPARGE